MKSFKQFILEDEKLTPEQVAVKILKDCQFFLRESKFDPEHPFYHALFRGIKTDHDDEILRKWKVDDSRQPKDMPLVLHDTLDDFFEEEFGVRFRSESVFATGSTQMAWEYGKVYLVFPIGHFEYIWSPVIRDAWEYFSEQHDYTSNQLRRALRATDNLYVNKNLDEGIKSRHEIMIACDSYYTLPLPYSRSLTGYAVSDKEVTDFVEKVFNFM